MGDIAWVRKYRPSSFDDYMGEDVKRMVISRFAKRDSIPNTIMLYGTRGTGKTSMARLLAKEIHCMNPIDGHSCGVCDMCKEIDAYISSTEAGAECPGITEVDAATTTGKSDINDIIEDALIPPMYPLEHKIIILDECHMLSNSAQNSLLKVIEEPPSYLIFILCTTDPEKVIGTIHSRMQLKLEVKKKSVDEMVHKLTEIAEKENLTISPEALQIIAKKGDRIPRECINLLESIAKNFDNNITVDNVRLALGDIANAIYIKYYEAANSSLYNIFQVIKEMKEQSIAPKDFIKGLTRFTLDALNIKFGVGIEDFSTDFVKQIKPLFKYYKVSDCDALLQIIEHASTSMDSDDTKSELIIVNTAMRIGKVNLLSKGLSGQDEQARNENISSVRKYAEIIEEQRKEAIEKIPEADIKKETFAELFSHMSEVVGADKETVNQTPISDDAEDGYDENTREIMALFNQS